MLEPQENGLVDLPDYEHVEDETFPPFPPPASPQRDGEGAEPDEGLYRDFIDRVEYLGNKKEVQTCLKRIRLDLPILHEDFVSNDDEVGESKGLDVTAAELDPFLTDSSESEKFASESSRNLTEEQQQRIERNKQLALERRQAKLLSNSQSLGNGK
uniref:TIMELESS-interacting protein n=1 Tax=Urocitellus parryii TaxID=9999 RepID=UPI000E558FA7|nr:TIMELESS-interacting protein [Urocitellus parryii]